MPLFEDETIRDALPSEGRVFELEEKLRVLNLLVEAGVKCIQVGFFVNPNSVSARE